MIETAVILAAGMGRRLKGINKKKPKGFISFENGLPIIEESILKLFNEGVERILIGTGYADHFYKNMAKKFSQITCVKNTLYEKSGSMYTLFNLRRQIRGDFLLLDSDIIYERKALREVIKNKNFNIILASGETDFGDEVFVEVDQNKNLINLSKDIKEINNIYGEMVGISKISKDAFRLMCDLAKEDIATEYEQVILKTSRQKKFFVKKIENLIWCEIDNKPQLTRALNEIYPKIKKNEKK